ncbi:hypothetical protein D9V84_09410 [Bacteroidetes/Chlorobi group bacterium Naka2016]|jgi:hypothetical protein|nr:MAG: hypothetical protein D9V84_09410 [Bacteroidetes/Chlorobi group bacterium Naka2016]
MKKVILLATAWHSDYWESDKEAPYPGTTYTQLKEWDELSQNCPLAGLGIYIKQKENDFRTIPFVYLKITGMRYDPITQQPYFNFKVIKKASRESIELSIRLPSETRRLFSAINADQLIKILNEIGEKPPAEWLSLIESGQTSVSWEDYIGKYFLDLKSGNLSNDEFEDRIYNLLTALGFDVIQKGHKIRGEYCDGVAIFEGGYGIVYDCKNTVDFIPTAENKRALAKYLEDEKKLHEEKNLFNAFIAESFGLEQNEVFYFSIDALLYLLYKKLIMGSKFRLSPFKKILDNKMSLTIETIKKEWL